MDNDMVHPFLLRKQIGDGQHARTGGGCERESVCAEGWLAFTPQQLSEF
jgi:hypothetical protein